MNGKDWTELDRRKNDINLKKDFAVYSFEVESRLECRFVRLTQTGKNHWDLHVLAFCSLEIFGSLRPPRSLNGVEFPLKEAKSVDGIISYLTRRHDGNVHVEGIVTITASDMNNDPRSTRKNVADLTSDQYFWSMDEPGQWICWDFHEMRIRLTHYTIRSLLMKSWVVEGSLDLVNWTEIDRKTDNDDFKNGWETASFAVSKSAEWRFIRLTQTGERHYRDDHLAIEAFEVFGTLLE
jgi:hypothetical protein